MTKLRLTTINQLVEAILERKDVDKAQLKLLANELVIYWKMIFIAETRGIDKALAYYQGDHDGGEYLEFMTSIVGGEITSVKRSQIDVAKLITWVDLQIELTEHNLELSKKRSSPDTVIAHYKGLLYARKEFLKFIQRNRK
mgnify:CR=1 FL=1